MDIRNELVVRASDHQGDLTVLWNVQDQRAQLLLDDGDGPIFSVISGRDILTKLSHALSGTPDIGEKWVITILCEDDFNKARIQETSIASGAKKASA